MLWICWLIMMRERMVGEGFVFCIIYSQRSNEWLLESSLFVCFVLELIPMLRWNGSFTAGS